MRLYEGFECGSPKETKMTCAKCGRFKPKNPHQPAKMFRAYGLMWHPRCLDAATPGLIASVTRMEHGRRVGIRSRRM